MRTWLDDVRMRGIRLYSVFAWSISAILVSQAMGQNVFTLLGLLAALLVNTAITVSVIRKDPGSGYRILVGLLVGLQPTLLMVTLYGTGWQVEVHLLYYVGLVGLVFLCDPRPIVLAGTAIVLGEIGLAVSELRDAADPIEILVEVAIHCIAVLAIVGILCAITFDLGRIMGRVAEARKKSNEQASLLEEQAGELQEALHRVELERTARENLAIEKAQQRKSDLARFVREFERSIASVIQSVASTAEMLEQTTKELDRIAHETGDQARDVAGSAQSASNAADTVARGIAELSGAIANVAANVSQQDELTSRATQRSISGGEAVGSLTQHSDTIGEATRAIVRIAERTNLLSLNAAIEAATAGPAGRGFTIVAQEVKALAAQAGKAATEIDAFLSGVREGTVEAERSFKAIDAVVSELDRAAHAISYDVEAQRTSADTIEAYARTSAGNVGEMAKQTQALAASADDTKRLSSELDRAAAALSADMRNLESSTQRFLEGLKVA